MIVQRSAATGCATANRCFGSQKTFSALSFDLNSKLRQRDGRCRRWQVSASSSSTKQYVSTDREQHNSVQARLFDADAIQRLADVPKEVVPRLKRIAEFVPDLSSASRVLDVGSGPGVLIPHLQVAAGCVETADQLTMRLAAILMLFCQFEQAACAVRFWKIPQERGVQEILAVEVSPAMVDVVQHNFPSTAASEGNTPQVRAWLGDVQSLPAYQAPFDAAFFNSVFGNVFDQRDTLLSTALLLKPGGHILLSHPLGRQWLNKQLHEKDPEMVPHPLPDQASLADMISDLPLRIVDFVDEEEHYMALLQVPENYLLQQGPIRLHGDVTSGFGRGSKQLGFPTANLPPQPLAKELQGLPKGVYFGWARLLSPDYPEEDRKLHKMVMNIGQNPTVNEADAETTVEIHVLHKFSKDFYGQPMRAVAFGFIRPEMKFQGIGALIARIKTDAGIAAKQLDEPAHQQVMHDQSLHV